MLEVLTILLIVFLIISLVLPNYVVRIRNADYEKTVNELTAIAQASIDYFIIEGVWPVTISQLAPQFMPRALVFSPFGSNYQMMCINGLVTVSVLVPKGLAGKNPQGSLFVKIDQGNLDLLEISQRMPDELTSRLTYDLKYHY